MTEHKSYSKALQMHSIRGTARPASPLWDGSQNKNVCDTEKQNKNVFNLAFVGVTGLRLSLCFCLSGSCHISTRFLI